MICPYIADFAQKFNAILFTTTSFPNDAQESFFQTIKEPKMQNAGLKQQNQ
jgi:hypothetical protein